MARARRPIQRSLARSANSVTVSSSTVDSVLDTAVLRYFLLAERTDLLTELLGRPLGVPRTVFDPAEEEGAPEDVMSDVRRSIVIQQRRSYDRTRSKGAQGDAQRNAECLARIEELHAEGSVVTLDMTAEERALFSRMTSNEEAQSVGLRVALGFGEAACVAIAIHRGCLLVTDDEDALRVLHKLGTNTQHTRIRGLLQTAAKQKLLSRSSA